MYDEFPLRFCYEGNTFTNNSNLQGKLKEVTQMGAELINDGSVEADAEIIALVIEALFHTGLTEFQISVGNVEYFKGICAEAGIAFITKADGKLIIHKILGCTSCNRRGKVRTKHQRISFFIEKLI